MQKSGHFINIHSCMVIFLILFQHSCDIFFRKAHVHFKICRNVPGTVIAMFFFRAKFLFQIFNVIYSCQYDRLKCRFLKSMNVLGAKLGEKIQKNLLVRCAVYLINNKNDRFIRSSANLSQISNSLRSVKTFLLSPILCFIVSFENRKNKPQPKILAFSLLLFYNRSLADCPRGQMPYVLY